MSAAVARAPDADPALRAFLGNLLDAEAEAPRVDDALLAHDFDESDVDLAGICAWLEDASGEPIADADADANADAEPASGDLDLLLSFPSLPKKRPRGDPPREEARATRARTKPLDATLEQSLDVDPTALLDASFFVPATPPRDADADADDDGPLDATVPRRTSDTSGLNLDFDFGLGSGSGDASSSSDAECARSNPTGDGDGDGDGGGDVAGVDKREIRLRRNRASAAASRQRKRLETVRLRQRCRDLERAVAHARFATQCAHAEIAALRHALGYPPAPPPPFPVAVAPLPPLDVAASESKKHPPPASLGSLDDDRDATEPAALERGETKRPSRSICRSTMNRDRYRFVRRTRSRAWSTVDGIGEGADVVVVSRRGRRRAPNPNRRVVASVGFRSSPFVVARGEAARALSAAPRRATRAKECEPSSNDATIRIRRRGGLRRGERRGYARGSRRAACNASTRISSDEPAFEPRPRRRPRARRFSSLALLDRSSVY